MKRILLLLLILAGMAQAQSVTVTVYGFIDQTRMGATDLTKLLSIDPAALRRIHYSTVAIPIDPAIPADQQAIVISSLSSYQICRANLLPVFSGNTIADFQIVKVYADVYDQTGQSTSGPLYTWSANFPIMSTSPTANVLNAYFINNGNVYWYPKANNQPFTSDLDASTLRWNSRMLQRRGADANGNLTVDGIQWASTASFSSFQPLTDFSGAWVQFRDPSNGSYYYLTERELQYLSPDQYDPVAFNGQLLANGTCSHPSTQPIGVMQGSYSKAGGATTIEVTFTIAMAHGLSTLPANLQSQAFEQAPPPSTGSVNIDTSANFGQMATVSNTGAVLGNVQFFDPASNQGQSTQTLHTMAITAPDPNTPDATTPSTGTGASGLSLNEAMAQTKPPTADKVTNTGSSTGITLDYGNDPVTGVPRTQTLDSNAMLRSMDDALNQGVAVTVDTSGNVTGPQKKPVAIQVTSSFATQNAAGIQGDTITAMDQANTIMAQHMPGFTQWKAPDRKIHHGAFIYPVDIYEGALKTKYAGETGVTLGDREGNPVPGDGDNPYEPVPAPNRNIAGRPFYDFDDDGDLDRWATDDPFEGGYRRVRVQWRVEAGTKQLGDFQYNFANQVVVSGFKKPKKDPNTGTYALTEDLLFSMSHNYKPYDRRVIKVSWRTITYLTYYGAGLLTPLDPCDPGNPSLYQLALRNFATTGISEGGSDGVSPAEMVFTTKSSYQMVPYDVNRDGRITNGEIAFRHVTVYWYDKLPSSIFDATAVWGWCTSTGTPSGLTLPGDIPMRPQVAAIAIDKYELGDGTTLSSTQYATPYWPSGGVNVPFDPNTIPVRQPPPPGNITASTDGYMWDYPQGASTAQGGTTSPVPQNWQMPWNMCWNGDEHSTRHSTKTFGLNSANMAYFPAEYASMVPVITHDGLVRDAQEVGKAPSVKWLLREIVDQGPSGGYTLDQWRDGVPLFTQGTWVPGMEWLRAGRSPLHVFGWDSRTDMSGPGLGVGSVRLDSGSRVYEVLAGLGEYQFLGQKYRPVTVNDQVAIINKMWAYYFSGDLRYYNNPDKWILPSLCIPQRFNNESLTSRPLNTAFVPVSETAPVAGDPGNAGTAGGLHGSLLDNLANASSSPDTAFRSATERRTKLMREQVFLFSASRGREWELAMARRMPDSVRLICLEWDDKAYVQRMLAGRNIVYPETSSQIFTDSTGVTKTIEVSNEIEVLKELSRLWFDGWQTRMGFSNGAFGADGGAFNEDAIKTVANNIAASPTGFMRLDPGSQPLGLAKYAYELGSLPQSPRTWKAAPTDAAIPDAKIQFRHPMLVLYHDAASSIYVHYGRNCDPDEVFSHWDDCAPTTSITAVSAEVLRRQRFESWQTTPNLEDIYNKLHPDGFSAYLATRDPAPPGPPNPGSEPQAPRSVSTPGTPPVMPTAVASPVWTKPHQTWGNVGGSTSSDLTRLPNWATSYPSATQVDTSIDAVIDAWVRQMSYASNPGFLRFEDGYSPWYGGGLFPGDHIWEEGISEWGGHWITGYIAPRDNVSTYQVTFYRDGWNSGAAHEFYIYDAASGAQLLYFVWQNGQRKTITIPPSGVIVRWFQWDYHAFVVTFVENVADIYGRSLSGTNEFVLPASCYVDQYDNEGYYYGTYFSLEAMCRTMGDIYGHVYMDPIAKMENVLHHTYGPWVDQGWDVYENWYSNNVYSVLRNIDNVEVERVIVPTWTSPVGPAMIASGYTASGSYWSKPGVQIYQQIGQWGHYLIDTNRNGRVDKDVDLIWWGYYQNYFNFNYALSNRLLETYTSFSNCPDARIIAMRDKTAWTAYQSALAAYTIANNQFNINFSAYQTYLNALSAYEAAHAKWVSDNNLYQTWYNQNAGYLTLKAKGDQFASDRASWVLLIQSEVAKGGVGWSGDVLVQLSTLDQLKSIQPRLPIWEAYLYVLDPTHPVAAVAY